MRTLPPSLLRHLSRGWAISATPYGGAIVSVSAAVVSVNLLVVFFVVLRRCGADTGEVRRPSEAAPLSLERIRGSVPAAEQRRYGESGGLQCAVCLCRLRQPEALRLLSGCGHIFHVECADRWLEGRSSCPSAATRSTGRASTWLCSVKASSPGWSPLRPTWMPRRSSLVMWVPQRFPSPTGPTRSRTRLSRPGRRADSATGWTGNSSRTRHSLPAPALHLRHSRHGDPSRLVRGGGGGGGGWFLHFLLDLISSLKN
ncbi:unnamed protein product [Spirodela intermedia]|uniref:RING-type E3 ubiquitin transferase n=1 Tax=Spirodela intermedia TaxID=51605 RepID=A0A7I8JJN3_SPIIN|nr:unnamed protein product [Spirodela intermedia]CAA6670339.1 unnamed protein product [Spirodela intermedia]